MSPKVKGRKGKRDYAAEYKRRLERALSRGYSRAVARGHARKGEVSLKRAKTFGLPPGLRIVRQGRHGTPERPYRPTYADIRARARRLGLPLSGATFKGKKGKIPIAWAGPPADRYMKDDPRRDRFIEFYTTQVGLTDQEAYTLWFSP